MPENIVQKSSKDMYLDDMCKYSIIVNRRRAIPEIKDGLKPVQRRVIFDMFDEGAISYNRRRKSGKIVGDTMGNFHPHGDCLSGGTLLYTLDGKTTTIEAVYDSGVQSLNILSINPHTLKVEPAIATDFRIGQYSTTEYVITLSNGYIIKCTSNHPFMLSNGVYVKAEDLKAEMKLMTKVASRDKNNNFIVHGEQIPDYNRFYVVVENIQVNETESRPYYDFTVSGNENMLIPVDDSLNDNMAIIDFPVPMICIHNSSIYSCMEPLSNWWKSKVPLITGHGNWGTVMGDSPAAMRYTEAGLSDFGYECVIGELAEAKYVTDWVDNFDRTRQEPEYLPAKVPLILINGSFGIGLGITCNIPTHNTIEVIDACRKLIKNPNYHVVLVPDHCQPLYIFDTDWKKIADTGYGRYTVRGIVEKFEDKGYPVLAIKSLPDNVTTTMVIDKLMALVEAKQLPMVKDIIDQSAATVDIRVILKKGSDINYMEEILYSKTPVQDNITINFEVVDGVNHLRLSQTEYLKKFLEFRATTKFRLYCNKYKVVSTRMHKLETFIKFIESGEIDNIISMVKKQKTTDDRELSEYLIKKLNITDLQAGFILSTDIKYLSRGHLERYKAEFKEQSALKEQYRKAITDDGTIIMNEIDSELEYISKKYGKQRICKVIEPQSSNNIPAGIFKIVITEKNYIRKIPDNEKINVIKGDTPRYILQVDNRENIILFDNKGKCFKLPVYKVPVTDKSSAGTDIRIMIRNLTANIISVYYEPTIKKIVEGSHKHYMAIVTRDNIIKRLDLEDFLNVNASGLVYSKVKDTDEVTGIIITPTELDIVIYSNQRALRCKSSDIPLLKRNAAGAKAMNCEDPIEGLSVIYPDMQSIVVVTNNGKFNKFPINCLSTHKRGSAGSNVIKLDGNDSILQIFGVTENDIIKITSSEGIEDVLVSDIKSKSGIAVGQKMLHNRGVVIKAELIHN